MPKLSLVVHIGFDVIKRIIEKPHQEPRRPEPGYTVRVLVSCILADSQMKAFNNELEPQLLVRIFQARTLNQNQGVISTFLTNSPK